MGRFSAGKCPQKEKLEILDVGTGPGFSLYY